MLSSRSIHTIPRTLKQCPSFPMGSRKNPTLHGVGWCRGYWGASKQRSVKGHGYWGIAGQSFGSPCNSHFMVLPYNYFIFRDTNARLLMYPMNSPIDAIINHFISHKNILNMHHQMIFHIFSIFQVFGIVFLLPSDQANAVSSPCAFGLSGPCDGACRRFWGNWCAIGRFSMGLVESLNPQCHALTWVVAGLPFGKHRKNYWTWPFSWLIYHVQEFYTVSIYFPYFFHIF